MPQIHSFLRKLLNRKDFLCNCLPEIHSYCTIQIVKSGVIEEKFRGEKTTCYTIIS